MVNIVLFIFKVFISQQQLQLMMFSRDMVSIDTGFLEVGGGCNVICMLLIIIS